MVAALQSLATRLREVIAIVHCEISQSLIKNSHCFFVNFNGWSRHFQVQSAETVHVHLEVTILFDKTVIIITDTSEEIFQDFKKIKNTQDKKFYRNHKRILKKFEMECVSSYFKVSVNEYMFQKDNFCQEIVFINWF